MQTSDFYRDNYFERYDNPITRLPELENGNHTHELRGLAAKRAADHH